MSDVYTVREVKGVWTVCAGETPLMTFRKEADALEYVKEAQKLVEETRAKDSKPNVLPWRRH
jgi:GH24 family phage-related lysozyme (muramidase)